MLLLNYKSGLIVCHLPCRCQILKTINSASFRPHVCSQVPLYVSCYLVNYMCEFIRIFKYLTLWLSLFISGHFLVSKVLLSRRELAKEKMVLVWYSTYNLNNDYMTVVIRSSCDRLSHSFLIHDKWTCSSDKWLPIILFWICIVSLHLHSCPHRACWRVNILSVDITAIIWY